MDTTKVICDNLIAIGLEPDTLSKIISKYIVPIEDIIQLEAEKQEAAIQTLKEVDISFSSISEKLNCSRTTLYNNAPVKKYIDYSAHQLDSKNPLNIIAEQKKEISRLQEQISKMILRDIQLELLQSENTRLKQLNKSLREDNKRLIALINKRSKNL